MSYRNISKKKIKRIEAVIRFENADAYSMRSKTRFSHVAALEPKCETEESIVLSENTAFTKNFDIYVNKVIFEDGSVWICDKGEEWSSLGSFNNDRECFESLISEKEYSYAVSLYEKTYKMREIKRALALFENLSDFRDAKVFARVCKKKMRMTFIGQCLAIICIAFLTGIIVFLTK